MGVWGVSGALPGNRPFAPVSWLCHPSLEGRKSSWLSWEIQKTQEKGLSPQISWICLSPHLLNPHFCSIPKGVSDWNSVLKPTEIKTEDMRMKEQHRPHLKTQFLHAIRDNRQVKMWVLLFCLGSEVPDPLKITILKGLLIESGPSMPKSSPFRKR